MALALALSIGFLTIFGQNTAGLFSCETPETSHDSMTWVWCPSSLDGNQVQFPHNGELPSEEENTSKEATAL